MRSINYLISPAERLVGVRISALIRPSVRRPAAAFALTLVVIGLLHGIQHARLRLAMRDLRVANERLGEARGRAAAIDDAAAELDRLRGLERRINQLRRSGIARASEVAALGNVLPHDVWLSALRFDREGYALDGGGKALSSIGATIASLAALPRFGGARLVAVRADRDHRTVTYTIAVEQRR